MSQAELVYFSFVGLQPRTKALHELVVNRAGEKFSQDELVANFGDPLHGCEGGLRIDGERKREKPPIERLGLRGSWLLGRLRRDAKPQVDGGATLGFFRRLGADTWMGANGHQLDLRTLELWEAFVRLGLKEVLGLPTPECYYHTDGDDRLEHLLKIYCEGLGQEYVKIPPKLDTDDQGYMILEDVTRRLEKHRSKRVAA